MSNSTTQFNGLNNIADHFREDLKKKNYILLFAHNGIGKTRLSMSFREAQQTDEKKDTLYFNAFTEDLFSWDNDLENDRERVLKLNEDSKFFDCLKNKGLALESKIGLLLERYAKFNFRINYEKWEVIFERKVKEKENDNGQKPEHIKISRGEENIFIWCFFLAIAQLAVERQEPYEWVKYLYIDDPISSLDDNNAIAVAGQLAHLLKNEDSKIKTVISSHHALFFNVMYNELKRKEFNSYFLDYKEDSEKYLLHPTNETPFFHHVALLKELYKVAESGKLYTYHFNILRTILEKTASFHGFNRFSDCIKQSGSNEDNAIRTRMINVLNHGNYSLFEPKEMVEENKKEFKKILDDFRTDYRFNTDLFQDQNIEENQQ